jgi:hypothetical protein
MKAEECNKSVTDVTSEWMFIKGEGWRPELKYLCLLHKTYKTIIEIDTENGRSLVFKAQTSGTTPENTPGNTPRYPNKVKLCRDDAYVSDWRFNARALSQKLESGAGGERMIEMTEGKWTFKIQDPVDSARQVFNRFDVNGDNDISRDELKPMLAAMGFIVTDEQVAEVYMCSTTFDVSYRMRAIICSC